MKNLSKKEGKFNSGLIKTLLTSSARAPFDRIISKLSKISSSACEQGILKRDAMLYIKALPEPSRKLGARNYVDILEFIPCVRETLGPKCPNVRQKGNLLRTPRTCYSYSPVNRRVIQVSWPLLKSVPFFAHNPDLEVVAEGVQIGDIYHGTKILCDVLLSV